MNLNFLGIGQKPVAIPKTPESSSLSAFVLAMAGPLAAGVSAAHVYKGIGTSRQVRSLETDMQLIKGRLGDAPVPKTGEAVRTIEEQLQEIMMILQTRPTDENVAQLQRKATEALNQLDTRLENYRTSINDAQNASPVMTNLAKRVTDVEEKYTALSGRPVVDAAAIEQIRDQLKTFGDRLIALEGQRDQSGFGERLLGVERRLGADLRPTITEDTPPTVYGLLSNLERGLRAVEGILGPWMTENNTGEVEMTSARKSAQEMTDLERQSTQSHENRGEGGEDVPDATGYEKRLTAIEEHLTAFHEGTHPTVMRLQGLIDDHGATHQRCLDGHAAATRLAHEDFNTRLNDLKAQIPATTDDGPMSKLRNDVMDALTKLGVSVDRQRGEIDVVKERVQKLEEHPISTDETGNFREQVIGLDDQLKTTLERLSAVDRRMDGFDIGLGTLRTLIEHSAKPKSPPAPSVVPQPPAANKGKKTT